MIICVFLSLKCSCSCVFSVEKNVLQCSCNLEDKKSLHDLKEPKCSFSSGFACMHTMDMCYTDKTYDFWCRAQGYSKLVGVRNCLANSSGL